MVPPKAGTFGTMGRNIFRDTGFKNVDFSVFKTFKFKEQYSAQFRAEFFNLFNHPIIANPYGSANGSQLGWDPSAPGGFGSGGATPDVAAGNPLVGSGSARVNATRLEADVLSFPAGQELEVLRILQFLPAHYFGADVPDIGIFSAGEAGRRLLGIHYLCSRT